VEKADSASVSKYDTDCCDHVVDGEIDDVEVEVEVEEG
jgi:hypothetical protein